MAHYYKDGNGVKHRVAGMGLIDRVLSLTSHHAIANDVVTAELNEIRDDIATLQNNDIGVPVNISNYTAQNPYVIPSDGYVVVFSNYAAPGTTATGIIRGSTSSNKIFISATATTNDSGSNSVFVRKGMLAYFASNDLTHHGLIFMPIE